MQSPPRSERYNDLYFSAENGLAETRHVFLDGNNLPEAWCKRAHFTIAETGFGTGLNFLAAWDLFEKTAQAGQALHYISFEKFPLEEEEIGKFLEPWRDELGSKLDRLCEEYPNSKNDIFECHMDEKVRLMLIFDDVNAALPKLNAAVDCWFLDGFKPATNPEMWTEVVFQNMARCSAPGATFATFTAAGFVKRGLQAAGFDVQKVPGFGTKRDMLIGRKP